MDSHRHSFRLNDSRDKSEAANPPAGDMSIRPENPQPIYTWRIFAYGSLFADGPNRQAKRWPHVPIVALKCGRERRTPNGLLPATEPLFQDGLHPLFGGPKANFRIIQPGPKVHGGDHVRVRIPPALKAGKTGPHAGC